MTGQISDTVTYKGDNYVVIGERASGLFYPRRYGIRPEMIDTACYRILGDKWQTSVKEVDAKWGG
jgi:hypothetical protein